MISIDQCNDHSKSNHEIGVYSRECLSPFSWRSTDEETTQVISNGCLPSLWSPRRAYLSQCLRVKMIVQKRFSARMRLPTFGKVLPPPLFNLQLNREKQFSVDFPRHQEAIIVVGRWLSQSSVWQSHSSLWLDLSTFVDSWKVRPQWQVPGRQRSPTINA